MQDDEDKGSPEKDARRDRLKLALRENLKRRKAQARGRSDASAPSSVEANPSREGGNDASD